MADTRFDYEQFSGRAGALANAIVEKYGGDLVPAITEALCHFAETAVRAEDKRRAVLVRRVVAAYDAMRHADEGEHPSVVDEYRKLDAAVAGIRDMAEVK